MVFLHGPYCLQLFNRVYFLLHGLKWCQSHLDNCHFQLISFSLTFFQGNGDASLFLLSVAALVLSYKKCADF